MDGLLLSGGMDSIAIAFWKRPRLAITIDYGQRPAEGEIRAASAASAAIGIEHHVITVDLSALGSGDMARTPALGLAPLSEWWPYRNQMLITLAAMKGIGLGMSKLLIGTLKTDGGHADGRFEFVDAISKLMGVQEGAIAIEAPAIKLTATELIRTSTVPMEILAWAHSCHVSDYACGMCGGCRKHYTTLESLNVPPY